MGGSLFAGASWINPGPLIWVPGPPLLRKFIAPGASIGFGWTPIGLGGRGLGWTTGATTGEGAAPQLKVTLPESQ